MTESVPQRIGDAERDRAAECLREHLAQGRLDQSEFEERLEGALRARTAADLTPLFSDLPPPRPDSAGGPSATTWPAYTPVPTPIADPAPAVAPPAPSGTGSKTPTALMIASAAAWPAWLLFMFATGWEVWWLVFIPIMITSMAGKFRHDRHDRPGVTGRDRSDRRELGQ